jgi:amino acid permease
MIADSGNGDNKKLAMTFLMYIPVLAVFFLVWAAFIMIRNNYGLQDEKEANIEQKDKDKDNDKKDEKKEEKKQNK